MKPLPRCLFQPLQALVQAWEGIEIVGEAAAVDQLVSRLPEDEVPEWLPPLLARMLRARSHAELEECRREVAGHLQEELPRGTWPPG